MCQCLEGDKVDWENLRTKEQQEMMSDIFSAIRPGMQMGATQFPGQLSAPKTRMQEMAERTMGDIGGWGYKPQRAKYESVPKVKLPTYDPGQNIERQSMGGATIQPGGLEPYGGRAGATIQPGGLTPAVPPPGPGGPGPGPGDDERKKRAMQMMIQMLAMGGQPGGQSGFDPRNIRPM